MSFHIESTKEHLENTGGLVLAGELARACGLFDLVTKVRTWKGALLSMFGLLAMGRSSFEEIAIYRKDEFFRETFHLEYVPARETLRMYPEIPDLL